MAYLQQHYPDDAVVDLPVYSGQERLACRLLAYRRPEEVVKQRQRKALEEARKKGRGALGDSYTGFDHGVGHPLLFLCDAKVPNSNR